MFCTFDQYLRNKNTVLSLILHAKIFMYLLITRFRDRASGGKFVDASPAVEKHLADELEKLARVYGAKGDEFTKFPTFNFTGNNCHCVTFSFA